MAGENGGKPIVRVEMDLSQWDSFIDSYQSWNKKVEEMPDTLKASSKGTREIAKSWANVEKSFDAMVKTATADKFASSSSGVLTRMTKTSKEAEKSWTSIAKSIEKSGRFMTNLTRDGMSFASALGMIGGPLGLLAAGVAGATEQSAADLSRQNAQNRSLGLRGGEEQSFENTFGPTMGLDSSLVAMMGSAKVDQNQWRYLQAAGLSMQDIHSKDPAELAIEFAEKMGQQFNARGPNFGNWASSQGLTQYMSANQARLAGSYSDQFGNLNKQFESNVPRFAAQQKAYDEATKIDQELGAFWQSIKVKFEQPLVEDLGPKLLKLAGEAETWVEGFAQSGALEKDFQALEDIVSGVSTAFGALEDVLDWFKGEEADLPSSSSQLGKGVMAAWADAKRGDWSAVMNDLNQPITDGSGSGGTGGALNNPGGLEIPGKHGQFQKFDTLDEGVQAMDRQLMRYFKHDHLSTIQDIVAKYSPAKDGNNVAAYVDDVAKALGVKPGDKLDMDDPKVRAALEAAMIHHEGLNKGLDAKTVRAMINGKLDDDPQIIPYTKPQADADTIGGFPVVPFDGSTTDQQNSPQFRNISGLNDIAANLKTLVHDTFGEGAGSRFRQEDRTQQRIQHQGNQPYSPYNVNINVTTPTGSNTTATMGSLAQ